MKKIAFIPAVFLLAASVANSATFKEDFNGAMLPGWQPTANYSIDQSGGVMQINVGKYQGWQNFSLDLGSNYDISANPYANVKIRAPKGLVFGLFLVDADGNELKRETRVIGTGDDVAFNNYFFDFSGTGTIDRTKIRSITINVNERSLSFNATLWIDDLVIGDDAVKFAEIGSLPAQKYYTGTKEVKLQLTDIKNAASIEVSGGSGVIGNPSVSAIDKELALLTFDVKDVAALTTETVTLTAKGSSGYTDKTVKFDISVESNLPPTIDSAEPIDVPAGIPYTVTLTGISDGNSTVEQMVTITPGTVAGITDVSVKYNNGDSKAALTFTAAAGLNYQLPVVLKDNGAGSNTTNATLTINAYNDFNYLPDFTIYDTEVYSTESYVTMPFAELTDGDGGVNFSSITAISSDDTVADNITVESVLGQPTNRYLKVEVMGEGVAEITVTVTDDGGTATNNGNQTVTKKIKLEVLAPPLSGYTIDFDQFDDEYAAGIYIFEGDGVSTHPSIVDDAGGKYLLLDYLDKWTYEGWWYYAPEMDLTAYPYMSYELYPEDNNMRTHTYFYDNEERRNDNGATDQQKSCNRNQWTKVFLDFRNPKLQTEGTTEETINMTRIKTLLFNIHTSFGWPFTDYTGKVRIRNIRIGSAVLPGDIPTYTPSATIDGVSNQYYYAGSGTHTVTLTGITDGMDKSKTPTLAVSATAGASYITDLTTAPTVNANGEATISFTVAADKGRSSTIQVKASATGSDDNTITFNVFTIDDTSTDAATVTLDLSVKGFALAGLGANPNAKDIDLFAHDWGGSTVRLFLIGDEIEPVNDNSDPNSLDRSKISREGLRCEYVKQLAAAGVEHIFLTILSPPSWMKQNLSNDYYTDNYYSNSDQSDNKVPDYYFDEYVEFMVACEEVIKEETGIELAGICAQNEPEFCEPYGSAILDAQRMARLYIMTGKRFAELGIKTKLIYCETPWGWCQGWASQLANNAEAFSYTEVMGVHYPSGNANWSSLFNTLKQEKEIWGAEVSAVGNNWASVQREVNNVLSGFNYGLTQWCVFGFSGGSAMVQGNTPTRNYYGFKNLTRYIRPGDIQIKSTCSSADITMAAFECGEENRITFVMSNNADEEKKIVLPPQAIKYTIYRSSSNDKCIEVPKAEAVREDMLLLPPKSITTVVIINESPLYMDQPEDINIERNAPEQTVTLTGIGSKEGSPTITITATSNYTALIPNPVVTYTSPQETATLTFTPEADQEGTATITVTLSATGVDPRIYTFNVTVSDIGIDIIELSPVVYPNPATDFINYDALFAGEGWNYTVISVNGATMTSSGIAAGSTGLKVDVSTLTPGWYVLYIANGKKTIVQPFQKR